MRYYYKSIFKNINLQELIKKTRHHPDSKSLYFRSPDISSGIFSFVRAYHLLALGINFNLIKIILSNENYH